MARILSDSGVPLTLLTRRPEAVRRLPGSRTARLAYEDSPAVREALAGVSTLFMVMADVADAVSARLGRTVPYVDQTVEEAYASRRAWPAEAWQYDAWVSTYTAIRDGEQAGISGDVEAVLGRRPESLQDYLDRIGL